MGTNLHQATITNLRLGLNEIAAAGEPGQPTEWQALSQTILTGLWRRDGSRYQVLPDVFVYRHPIDERRASVSLAADGPPVLIIEIASDATYESDLDLEFGKGYSYAAAGVLEYLALDPTGEFIPERGRGWRWRDGVYVPWLPESTGRWQSTAIPVALAVEGARVALYNAEGERQLREGEITLELRRRERAYVADMARRDQALATELARRDEAHLAELARRDEAHVAELARHDQAHAAELARLAAELARRDVELARLDADLARRDTALERLQAGFVELTRRLDELTRGQE